MSQVFVEKMFPYTQRYDALILDRRYSEVGLTEIGTEYAPPEGLASIAFCNKLDRTPVRRRSSEGMTKLWPSGMGD